jgi:hypothetical protein
MAKGDRAKTFIQQVLGKITDPGLRTQAEAVFANPVVVADLDDGVAGQSEIDRQLHDLKVKTDAATQLKTDLDTREADLQKWHDGLTKWRGDNEDLVKLGVEAKKANWKPGDPPPQTGGRGNGDPNTLPAGVVTEETLRATLGGFESSVLGFAADQNLLMRQHYDHFKEILDVTPLIKHPQIKDLGLVGVYNLVHKAALDAKAKETQDAHDKKIADEAVAKFRAEQSTQLPYPLASGPGSGSPLDGLNAKVDAAAGSLVDRAALEYQRLQQGRPAAS